jgi:hypothetical protein
MELIQIMSLSKCKIDSHGFIVNYFNPAMVNEAFVMQGDIVDAPKFPLPPGKAYKYSHDLGWGLIEDLVGTKWHNPAKLSEVFTMRKNSDVPPAGWLRRSDTELIRYRAAKWVEIKAGRAVAEASEFTFRGKKFSTDLASTQKMIAASQAAAVIGNTFSIDWLASDNTVLTLNRQGITEMVGALFVFWSEIHAKSQRLRSEIDACTTVDQVRLKKW